VKESEVFKVGINETDMELSAVTCPICASPARYDFSSRDIMFELYDRHDYFTCIECESTFLMPTPTSEQLNSFYPADYMVFDQTKQNRKLSQYKKAILWQKYAYKHLAVSAIYKLLAPLLTPFLHSEKPAFIEGGSLLDVGAGNGRYLLTMKALGWNVQGVEMSDDGVKVCRSAGLNVHHGDLVSAEFVADSFDVITVRHVIEHITQPHPFMAELARVLKPGGKLIIETPNSQALGRAMFGANWYANDVPRHVILFSPDTLNKLVEDYGLISDALRLTTSPKIFLNSLDYLTANKGKPSKRVRWKRLCARVYVWFARSRNRGDTIHAVYTK